MYWSVTDKVAEKLVLLVYIDPVYLTVTSFAPEHYQGEKGSGNGLEGWEYIKGDCVAMK